MIGLSNREKEHPQYSPGWEQHPVVLVIGGAGYLGSLVVRHLLNQGYAVRLLDKFIYGDDSVRELYSRNNFDVIEGDFRQVEDVVKAMHDVDAVVHLGAIVGDPACVIDERQTILTNLAATRMIAEIARGFRVERFLFASTCSVYGTGDRWLNENSSLNPVSLYARTKVESERVLLELGDERFSPTILRLATLYGMSPRPRFDLVINLLAAMAKIEGHITVFGGGQWRPFLHVDDAATGFCLVLNAPVDRVRGATFNLGTTEQNYQIRDLATIISRVIPGVVVDVGEEFTDARDYRVRFDRLQDELGFTARHTVEQGVQEVARAIDEGIVSDYRLDRYNNYKFLSDETQRARIQLNHSIFSYDIVNRSLCDILDATDPGCKR